LSCNTNNVWLIPADSSLGPTVSSDSNRSR
jgi:hypothetical protein